uniref:Uncharacterized protein n=1 Tax=uncultured marine group II/III euryarchaeote SAT1000_02_F02 TaxID=1456550 RepID=A0A075I3E0_9EURY|nr:hypothetical protein [uncultured marine group II/III euryarchaeote SAT1000_02_F02]
MTASSPCGITAGTIPIQASLGSSGAVKEKSIFSPLLNDDRGRVILIPADFGSATSLAVGSLDPPATEMVILPTPTHLLVPVGSEPSPLGRDQPPLYQSLLPSCSLSSRLHEGAPPLLAL